MSLMERNRDGREDGRREAKRAVDERSEAAAGPVPAGAPDPELAERPRRAGLHGRVQAAGLARGGGVKPAW